MQVENYNRWKNKATNCFFPSMLAIKSSQVCIYSEADKPNQANCLPCGADNNTQQWAVNITVQMKPHFWGYKPQMIQILGYRAHRKPSCRIISSSLNFFKQNWQSVLKQFIPTSKISLQSTTVLTSALWGSLSSGTSAILDWTQLYTLRQ